MRGRLEDAWHRWVLCPRGRHVHKFSAYDVAGRRGACIYCGKPLPTPKADR